eukprot:5654-Eustigmatos_ZCMA.PRE.1
MLFMISISIMTTTHTSHADPTFTVAPTKRPTSRPTKAPTPFPTTVPTGAPTPSPSQQPTKVPTGECCTIYTAEYT